MRNYGALDQTRAVREREVCGGWEKKCARALKPLDQRGVLGEITLKSRKKVIKPHLKSLYY